jgi:hypothetical protein
MPEQQMAHQPENYTNYADHMKQVWWCNILCFYYF